MIQLLAPLLFGLFRRLRQWPRDTLVQENGFESSGKGRSVPAPPKFARPSSSSSPAVSPFGLPVTAQPYFARPIIGPMCRPIHNLSALPVSELHADNPITCSRYQFLIEASYGAKYAGANPGAVRIVFEEKEARKCSLRFWKSWSVLGRSYFSAQSPS